MEKATGASPILIKRPNTKTVRVTIVGTAPLIVHQFSEKAKRQMRDKQAKKATTKRATREPDKEFEQAKYKMANGKDGFPALAIKQAMVGSARFTEDAKMTVLRGVIFVKPDETETGLIEIKSKKCEMVEDVVRLSGIGKPADLRYRPYYYGWSMDLKIVYDADVVSIEQVMNLLSRAGLSQGLGEWRPERNGQNGMFEIKEK